MQALLLKIWIRPQPLIFLFKYNFFYGKVYEVLFLSFNWSIYAMMHISIKVGAILWRHNKKNLAESGSATLLKILLMLISY